MSIDTKLARMVIYCARLPPLKPQDPWIMDQHEVTWKFEKYVSPFQVLTEFWQCADFRKELQRKRSSRH